MRFGQYFLKLGLYCYKLALKINKLNGFLGPFDLHSIYIYNNPFKKYHFRGYFSINQHVNKTANFA